VQGPVGIAQHFAGEKDHVGVAGGDDLIGLCGFCDHADGGRGNSSFSPDAGGERHLETGADGNAGVRNLAARGDVDEVNAMSGQQARQFYGFVG
jgi:hypothetical protein